MNFAWIDLETTGDDEFNDPIIEVGVVITDDRLNELANAEWAVCPSVWPDTISGTVVRMHAENRLWSDVSDGMPIDQVDHQLANLLDEFKTTGKIPLAGSGVGHFDGRFIRAQMPESAKRLTYWPMDIGVVRRFATYILGAPEQQGSTKTHRALDDARWHVEEARHWAITLGEARA